MEQYKRLRQRDSTGSVSKSAWRITVRQLESMIRLSEAMARMHCCDEVRPNETPRAFPASPFCLTFFSLQLQVQPKHVKEAFRLLNKSIIRVETPDINLEQEDEVEEEEQQEEGDDTLPINRGGGSTTLYFMSAPVSRQQCSKWSQWSRQWPHGGCERPLGAQRSVQAVPPPVVLRVQAHLQPAGAPPAQSGGGYGFWIFTVPPIAFAFFVCLFVLTLSSVLQLRKRRS